MTATETSALRDGDRRTRPSPLGARLFAVFQRLLPQHALSGIVRRLTRVRRGPVRSVLISAFVRSYAPAMDEAAQADPFAYESFNALFTRSLKPGARPIDPDPAAVVSPVDGTVSQIGALDGLTLVQAKGRNYRLDALLARADPGARFSGGSYATLYLAPFNYHRIHLPLAARLQAAWYVPGRLFSVNAATSSAVANLYARNERIICMFETAAGASFAMVLVGALFVGSMATLWHGDVTPRRPRKVLELPVPAGTGPLGKGAEIGRFNMGSTVIVLFPPDTVCWVPQLAPGSRIAMGQRLGSLAVPA